MFKDNFKKIGDCIMCAGFAIGMTLPVISLFLIKVVGLNLISLFLDSIF